MLAEFLRKVESSKKVDFGAVLTKCVELYKKTWQQGAMHMAIIMAAVIPLIILVYASVFYFGYTQRSNTYYYEDSGYSYGSNDPNVAIIILAIVLFLILMFVVQVLSMGISAHFYKVCKAIDLETNEPINEYFEFFKGSNLKRLLMMSLLSLGISLLALALCYLPIFYAIVPLQLMIPIFAFNPKLTPREVVKAAFELGNKHWIYVFGFYIISSQLAQLGVIACIVGVVFTASIVHLPVYHFYKDTIGFDEDEQTDNAVINEG